MRLLVFVGWRGATSLVVLWRPRARVRLLNEELSRGAVPGVLCNGAPRFAHAQRWITIDISGYRAPLLAPTRVFTTHQPSAWALLVSYRTLDNRCLLADISYKSWVI